jgi:putative membrane protein
MMGMGVVGVLLVVGLVFLLVVGAVVIAVLVGGQGAKGSSRGRAREILDERYARGEIDREEYERMRAELTQ